MEETRHVFKLQAVPKHRTLDEWKRHWIHDETAVHCAQCLAAQSILDAQRPFEHRPGCTFAHPDFAFYPWQDLARILRADVLQALNQG